MSLKLYTLITQSHDPYTNLALEEHLLKVLPPDAILLYLWQNAHTVVIGKNQNAYREVNITALEKDGGLLSRRLSGGGAVYHDLGNLNFTFILPQKAFNVEKQMAVIIGAVQCFGLNAELSGRNDAVIDGRKFSGNAYYQSGLNAYHHGTVLIHTDAEKMKKYLNVSQKKLSAKGVASVKSRVVNLCELNPETTVDAVRQALVSAYQTVYQQKSEPLNPAIINWDAVKDIRQKIADVSYLLGKQLAFTFEREERFTWGEIQLQLRVEKGLIREVNVFSDAMNDRIADQVRMALTGASVTHAGLEKALSQLDVDVARDILNTLEGDIGGL